MDPVTIGLVGGGAYLLAKRGGQTAPAPRPNDPAKLTAGVAAASGIAAGSQAAMVVAGAVAGAELGTWVDDQLGGHGGKITSTIAKYGGAIIGGATVLLALGVIGAIAYVIVVAVVVITYTIGWIIQDIQRLNYGQKGAQADYFKTWQATHDRVFTAMRANPSCTGLNDNQVEQIVWPLTDGYCFHLNRVAYRRWMKEGKGIGGVFGQSDGHHWQWGLDRGYFAFKDPENSTGTGDGPALKYMSDDYKRFSFPSQFVPPGAPTGLGGHAAVTPPPPSTTAKAPVIVIGPVVPSIGGHASIPIPPVGVAPSVPAIQVGPINKPTTLGHVIDPVHGPIDVPLDPRVHFDTGVDLCYLGQYMNYMSTNPNKIDDEGARCVDGQRRGLYDGTPGADGSLSYKGQTYVWRDLKKAAGL